MSVNASKKGVSRAPLALLAALFAVALLVPSAASAAGKPAIFYIQSPDPVTISATATSPAPYFETDVGAIECEQLTGTATRESASEMKITNIASSQCVAVGQEAEVDYNGCYYTFDAGTYEGEGTSAGSMDIDCPAGQEIEVNAASGFCTVKLSPQSGLDEVSYENGAVATLEVTQMDHSYEGFCGSGNSSKGGYFGTIAIDAVTDDEAELPVAIEISPPKQAEFSAPEATDFSFASEEQLLKLDIGWFECGALSADGPVFEEQSTSALTSWVEWEGCPSGLYGTLHANYNGCNFELNAGSSDRAETSHGTVDLVCPGGAEVVLGSSPTCRIELPEQSGLGPVIYTNDPGSGEIAVDFDLDNILYSYSGYCGGGSNNNGTLSGEATLSATDGEEPAEISISTF